MSSFAEPGANAFLDGTALPATLYVQLHVGDPGNDGTANVATETTRKSFTRTAAALAVSSNQGVLSWTNYPAAETVSHVSVWSASSGGTCWLIGDPVNVVMALGETLQIAIGDLVLAPVLWS